MSIYILVHTSSGAAASVAAQVARVKGVTCADTVHGPYDVIATIDGIGPHDVFHDMLPKVHSIEGVIRAVACPAASHEPIWGMGSEPDLLGVGV